MTPFNEQYATLRTLRAFVESNRDAKQVLPEGTVEALKDAEVTIVHAQEAFTLLTELWSSIGFTHHYPKKAGRVAELLEKLTPKK